jgi:hypothetical protein
VLDAGRSQAGKAVLVNGILPGQEFFDRERISAAGFLKREKSASDRCYDFGLASDDPTLGTRRWQVRNC